MRLLISVMAAVPWLEMGGGVLYDDDGNMTPFYRPLCKLWAARPKSRALISVEATPEITCSGVGGFILSMTTTMMTTDSLRTKRNSRYGMQPRKNSESNTCNLPHPPPPNLPSVIGCSFWVMFRSWSYVVCCLNCLLLTLCPCSSTAKTTYNKTNKPL